MDPQQVLRNRRDALYNFIMSNFNDYDFERSQALDEGFTQDLFDSFEQFRNYQRSVVDVLDESTLNFAEQFMIFITQGNIRMIDKEDMSAWTASGFIFVHGRIVFTHER